MAVIDDERGAALRREARRQPGRDVERGFRLFQHGAVGTGVGQPAIRLAREAEGERSVLGQADETLAPAAFRADILPDRQGVEEFVGEDDGGAGRHVGDMRVPGDRRARRGQGCLLPRLQHGARLDETDVGGIEEARHDARGPQDIGHQRAAPGPELDQAHGVGRAHEAPDLGLPRARSARRTSG